MYNCAYDLQKLVQMLPTTIPKWVSFQSMWGMASLSKLQNSPQLWLLLWLSSCSASHQLPSSTCPSSLLVSPVYRSDPFESSAEHHPSSLRCHCSLALRQTTPPHFLPLPGSQHTLIISHMVINRSRLTWAQSAVPTSIRHAFRALSIVRL